jgi:hypothetical protein
MRIRYALPALASVALAVGLAVGCSKPAATTAPTRTAATTPAQAEAKVELKEVSAAGFDHAIRGLQGKVVLVDAWFLG